MFRIDRRHVKITGSKAVKTHQRARKPADESTESGEHDALINEIIDDSIDGLLDELMGGTQTGDGFEEPGGLDTADDSELDFEIDSETEAEVEKDDSPSAEELAKQYIDAAEQELAEREREVMRLAKEQADKIVADAEAEAEKIRKEAHDKGFGEGKTEGEREGKRSYDDALKKQQAEDEEMLQHIIDEIAREMERVRTEQEEIAVKLSIEIVRKIINPVEEELGTVYLSQIKNVFRQMSSDTNFVIRVSPIEYEKFFGSGTATIELGGGSKVTASVIRDVELSEGDLVIDTDDVTVNAGLETQLQYVKLSFEQAASESGEL